MTPHPAMPDSDLEDLAGEQTLGSREADDNGADPGSDGA
jgi:hypothetical protein